MPAKNPAFAGGRAPVYGIIDAPPLGAVVVYRRGRGGGWRQVRAPKTLQPIAAVKLALGDDDVIRWTPANGRGSAVFLARDACALEAFRAAPPA